MRKGCIVFKKSAMSMEINSTLRSRQEIEQFSFLDRWDFSTSRKCGFIFKDIFIKQIIQKIASISIQELKIFNNSFSKVAAYINSIQFTQLLVLNLGKNEIRSFQDISVLKCPKLKQLDLSGNDLSTLISFRKSNFEQLQNLNLAANKIIHIGSIEQAQLTNLAFLSLNGQKVQGEDLYILHKANLNLKFLQIGKKHKKKLPKHKLYLKNIGMYILQ